MTKKSNRLRRRLRSKLRSRNEVESTGQSEELASHGKPEDGHSSNDTLAEIVRDQCTWRNVVESDLKQSDANRELQTQSCSPPTLASSEPVLSASDQQLDEKQKVRKQIADATHYAVCVVTGTDGMGHSLLYALCGSHLAGLVFQEFFYPQAGTLVIDCEPESEHSVCINTQHYGFQRGKSHCWFARNDATETQVVREIVDLTSRHYKMQIEALSGPPCRLRQDGMTNESVPDDKRPVWSRDQNPPDFIWLDGGTFPQLMRVEPDEAATKALVNAFEVHRSLLSAVLHNAMAHYEQATGSTLQRTVPRPATTNILPEEKIGRNSPCPCGSGRKFKKCCDSRDSRTPA